VGGSIATSFTFVNRRVSVIGAARSGFAAANALMDLGADVTLSDSKSESDLGTGACEARATGARCVFGGGPDAALPEGTQLVVTSPGVPATAAVLAAAVDRGIPIWSEVELAYRLTSVPVLAVTGTNGKTTTALLLSSMLREAGQQAIVCGNVSADEIKKTLVEAAREATSAYDVLVAEISSFQLEWVEKFAPRVAILTNVTADHLNRHTSFEEYAETKARIFAAQGPNDWAVVGYDNPVSRSIGARDLPARRVWFTTQGLPPSDEPCAWVSDGVLTVRLSRGAEPVSLLSIGDMPSGLPGAHSIANALAAAAAALAMGASPASVTAAIRGFGGVAHRMERVAEIDGVRYVNNSMCTNVVAAICSLEAMDRPTIVIAGGADKGLDFAPMVPALCARAKRLILIGSAADKMEAAFRAGGYAAISRADTLESAVEAAAGFARPGEAVLLSPSCASFDMFRDFEARGAAFRAAVSRLEKRS
jgi:UDP-N-acetylmuramoylalanine--D-glutamate ligase